MILTLKYLSISWHICWPIFFQDFFLRHIHAHMELMEMVSLTKCTALIIRVLTKGPKYEWLRYLRFRHPEGLFMGPVEGSEGARPTWHGGLLFWDYFAGQGVWPQSNWGTPSDSVSHSGQDFVSSYVVFTYCCLFSLRIYWLSSFRQ